MSVHFGTLAIVTLAEQANLLDSNKVNSVHAHAHLWITAHLAAQKKLTGASEDPRVQNPEFNRCLVPLAAVVLAHNTLHKDMDNTFAEKLTELVASLIRSRGDPGETLQACALAVRSKRVCINESVIENLPKILTLSVRAVCKEIFCRSPGLVAWARSNKTFIAYTCEFTECLRERRQGVCIAAMVMYILARVDHYVCIASMLPASLIADLQLQMALAVLCVVDDELRADGLHLPDRLATQAHLAAEYALARSRKDTKMLQLAEAIKWLESTSGGLRAASPIISDAAH